jgi:hypothetical protein
MFRYASDVTVARPASEVFAGIVDIGRWTEWTDMRDVRPDGSGPIQVGSTGTFSMPGPFRGPVRYELTDLEPGRQVTYRLEHPAFSWTAVMGAMPEAEGSRLATSGAFRLHGFWRLLQPVVAREVSRSEAAELVRLKAILESTPAAAMSAASQS